MFTYPATVGHDWILPLAIVAEADCESDDTKHEQPFNRVILNCIIFYIFMNGEFD